MAWDVHPHDATGFLFILQPTVVFKARVNLSAAEYPTAEIPYDGVTVGAYTDLKIGQTVLVGSTDGAEDRGRIYVRKTPTADTLYIGFSSRGRRPGEVDLIDNSYLTVVDLFEPWRRPSRMVNGQDIYKDYDLVTPATPAPIARIGGAGGLAIMDFVSAGVLAVTDLTLAGSEVTAESGTIIQTIWDNDDGTYTSGNSSSTAPDMTFPPGFRWLSAYVGDSNGRVSLPRKCLIVALEDEDDPLLLHTVGGARWRLTPEGVTFSCTLRELLHPADFLPGTVVVWLVRERRGGAASNLTGYQVKFAGWLDALGSGVRAGRLGAERISTITALDTAQRYAQLRGFASTMAREATPLNPNQMSGANIDRYLWWYLSWHTFLPCFADVTLSGDTTHPFTSFSGPGGSFYTVVDHLARAIAQRFTMDSRGRAAMRPDPLRLELAQRTATVLAAIGPGDIREIRRLKRSLARTGVVRATFTLVSTANASEAADDVADLHVKAPGGVEGSGPGDSETGHPQLAATIAEAQLRTGQDYARENALEDVLRITLAHGGDAGLEPALMQWVTLTTDDETIGWTDAALSAARALLLAVEYQYDDEANAMTCAIEVELETDGTQAALDEIAGEDTPELTQVNLRRGIGVLFGINTDGYLYCTNDFTTPSGDGGPSWTRVGMSIAGAQAVDWEYDAFCPLGVGSGAEVRGWIVTTDTIWRVTQAQDAAGVVYTQCLDLAGDPFLFAAYPLGERTLQSERGTPNRLLCVSNGGNDGTTWVTYSLDGIHWAAEVDIDTDGIAPSRFPAAYVSPRGATMIASSHADVQRSTADTPSFSIVSGLTFVTGGATSGFHTGGIHVPFDQPTDDVAYIGGVDGTTNKLYRVSLIGGTKTDITPVLGGLSYGPHHPDSISSSPTNRQIVVACVWSTFGISSGNPSNFAIVRSLDGGDTWDVLVAPTAVDFAHELAHVQVVDDDTAFFYGYGRVAVCEDLSGAGTIDERTGDLPANDLFVGIYGGA